MDAAAHLPIAWRWLDHAASVACGLAVAVALALAGSWLAGYSVLVESSDSMGPTIRAGDVVVTKRVHPNDVSVGQIVTFKDNTRSGELVTHRVVAMRQRDGSVAFLTRGDANSGKESWAIAEDGTLGMVVWSVPRIGFALSWLGRPPVQVVLGLLALVLIALALRRVWTR